MTTCITKGVKVTVETEFQPGYSNPAQDHFVFTYRITIENKGDKTIQLMSRHWEITDLTFPKREVDGDGVVGKQPILEPGQTHQYVSGCNLRSGIGKMMGYYTMEKILDGKSFIVTIPEFTMLAPIKLN
ncbi:MAG: Co2+/Mg2+ efflux protein ApaG [Cyclobacteriaceae bacterium]